MKKATVKLILDKRRKKANDTYPIVIRVTKSRITRYIFTEYSVIEADWNPEEQAVKMTSKQYRNVTRVNNHLHQQLLDAADNITKLNSTGEIQRMKVNDVRYNIASNEESALFKTFTDKIIAEFKEAKRLGNAEVYQQTLNFVERLTGRKDLTFNDIDFQMIKSLESKFLSNEGNTLNGLSFYLRTVRAIYNRAIKEGKASREKYPFALYSIKETKTRKRAIRKTDMDQFKSFKAKKNTHQWHTRNLFLFSFYNRGMNFADIANLRISDIENDRIIYNRSKTGKPLSVKLTDATREILKHYIKGKKPDDFVFPIIKRDTPELQRKDLYNERKLFNKYLNRIAGKLKIKGNITSYVARHSWATIGKELNVPIAVISEGLGHEDIKTTQIYLDDFDNSILDDANQMITG